VDSTKEGDNDSTVSKLERLQEAQVVLGRLVVDHDGVVKGIARGNRFVQVPSEENCGKRGSEVRKGTSETENA